MDNLLKTQRSITADFSLGNTGDWGGGVSNTMTMIGKFRVIKGIT